MENCYDQEKEIVMAVHLEWPEDLMQRLADEAKREGLSLDDYVLRSVLRVSSGSVGAGEQQRASERAGMRIRELRKGNILGSDLTVRDLVEEGRRF